MITRKWHGWNEMNDHMKVTWMKWDEWSHESETDEWYLWSHEAAMDEMNDQMNMSWPAHFESPLAWHGITAAACWNNYWFLQQHPHILHPYIPQPCTPDPVPQASKIKWTTTIIMSLPVGTHPNPGFADQFHEWVGAQCIRLLWPSSSEEMLTELKELKELK